MAVQLAKDPNPMAVGARVKSLRKSRDLSQTELGRITGLGQPAISAIERGSTKRPEAVSILRIAAALRTSPFYILWDHDLPDVVSENLGRFIEIWTHLPVEDRAKVVAYARGLFDARPPDQRRSLRGTDTPLTKPPRDTH